MKLIIAPHVDDDVIGCGGILDSDTTVWYCGIDEFHVVSWEDRVKEAEAVAELAGNSVVFGVGKVNYYQFNEIKDQLEYQINKHQPEEVFLPWPSYNQDHQTVYDAAMVAMRPHDRNHFVKRVLLYEEPDCFWPGIGEAFRPNYFRKIDIDKKLSLYGAMPSQVRGHRSLEAIKALAAVRGAAIMEDYAEAYHILRWVD